MRSSEVENAEVVGSDGAVLGRVARVLFHPSEPRAVALMVRRAMALGVIPLPAAYLPLASVAVRDGLVRYASAKLPPTRRAETSIGHHPDATVIWRGMPVRADDGSVVGAVADVSMAADGTVEGLDVSTGGVGDLAYGRAYVPGDMVVGFDGGAVAIAAAPGDLASSGGLVRTAAETAAVAAVKAGEVAEAAGAAVVEASYSAGKALRSAVRSPAAKKARAAAKGVADAFRSGYHPGDDGD